MDTLRENIAPNCILLNIIMQKHIYNTYPHILRLTQKLNYINNDRRTKTHTLKYSKEIKKTKEEEKKHQIHWTRLFLTPLFLCIIKMTHRKKCVFKIDGTKKKTFLSLPYAHRMWVCVYMYVWQRERESQRERKR